MTESIDSKLRCIAERQKSRFTSFRFRMMGTVKDSQQVSDKGIDVFQPVFSIWRPEDRKPVVILRWVLTYWCNYNCPYCQQSHVRYAKKRLRRFLLLHRHRMRHAFDNFPVEMWLEAFRHHFRDRRASLVLTGGEPFLDKKNIVPFLNALTSLSTIEVIRIDTNLFWDPSSYEEVDPEKIILLVSYHPSYVTRDVFVSRINAVLKAGFKIGMVNLVMIPEYMRVYEDLFVALASLGVPLHPNPLHVSVGKYSDEEYEMMKQELPEADYFYRTQLRSPYGKECLFPALGYQMNPIGRVYAGCHKHLAGSFFDPDLPPLFPFASPCPMNWCCALDMYSFLGEVNRNTSLNPLLIYSEILKARKEGASRLLA